MCVCAVVSTRLVAIFTGLCLLSWKLPCSQIAIDVAEVCSWAFSVLGAVAYVPQLVVTYLARGQGSLSYVSYALQALIAVPYVAYYIQYNDPPMDIPAEWWVFSQPPLLASAFLQGGVVLLGVSFGCFRWHQTRLGRNAMLVHLDQGLIGRNVQESSAPSAALHFDGRPARGVDRLTEE